MRALRMVTQACGLQDGPPPPPPEEIDLSTSLRGAAPVVVRARSGSRDPPSRPSPRPGADRPPSHKPSPRTGSTPRSGSARPSPRPGSAQPSPRKAGARPISPARGTAKGKGKTKTKKKRHGDAAEPASAGDAASDEDEDEDEDALPASPPSQPQRRTVQMLAEPARDVTLTGDSSSSATTASGRAPMHLDGPVCDGSDAHDANVHLWSHCAPSPAGRKRLQPELLTHQHEARCALSCHFIPR
jgi:hypothetical protein